MTLPGGHKRCAIWTLRIGQKTVGPCPQIWWSWKCIPNADVQSASCSWAMLSSPLSLSQNGRRGRLFFVIPVSISGSIDVWVEWKHCHCTHRLLLRKMLLLLACCDGVWPIITSLKFNPFASVPAHTTSRQHQEGASEHRGVDSWWYWVEVKILFKFCESIVPFTTPFLWTQAYIIACDIILTCTVCTVLTTRIHMRGLRHGTFVEVLW